VLYVLCVFGMMCVVCENVCCTNSVFLLLWSVCVCVCVCVLHVALYVLYVWCSFCTCDCDLCVVVSDRLYVWLAVGVTGVICDVCTVCGHAWSVSLTGCVVFTLRTVFHASSVQLCSVWGGFDVQCDVLFVR